MLTKDTLLIFRNEINDIDKKIVKLLAKRKTLILKIAHSKIENNQKIRDIEREKKLLNKLTNLGKEHHLSSDYITRLFKLIIEESVSTQNELLKYFHQNNNSMHSNFSFLGPKGSYSHIAVCKYADRYFKKYVLQEYSKFEEVVLSVEKKQSDYAILPIENSYSGFIDEIFDVLKKTNLFIVGEINIFIDHCLLTIKKSELHEIKTVYSHTQPLKQCSKFMKQFPQWKIKYTNSTSDAMRKITELNDISKAALGSEIGGKIYGLNILYKNISNQKNNMTRFILLSRNLIEISPKIPIKIILMLGVKKELNTLSEVLKILKEKKLMQKELHFKKIHKSSLEEILYIEIWSNISLELIKIALENIKTITTFIKIIGLYPDKNRC